MQMVHIESKNSTQLWVLFIMPKRGEVMATIRTAIQIQDRLSQPMRAMHNAVSMMVNQMEAMNAASGHMMDTSSIEIARRELARAADQFNRIENEIRESDNAQQRFTNHIRDGTDAADGLLGKIAGIVAAYLTLQSIGDVVKLSDEMTNIDARLNLAVESMPKLEPISTSLEVDTKGLTEVQQLQQQIFDAAQRSYAPYTQTADLVGKLSMNAKDAFGNTTEVVAFAELLNKQFGIAGTNAEGVTAATLQLTQALGSGVLRGEELNSVFESAPTIIQNIADHLGVSIGKIREMAADGELTASVVKNAMFAAADDINKKFNDMPLTFGQIWTEFQNNALWAFKGVLQQINNIFNSDRFAEFRESAGQSLQIVATLASYALSAIASVGGFIYDNWSFIGPVILGVAGIIGVLISYLTLARAAIIAITVAQWLWNVAQLANPIVWILMGIIAFIAVIYLAVAAINHFTGESISATGIIAGAFMVLVTYIYNKIAFLWNIFASIAEFFVNVWSHPMYSVKKLFYNLASNVLDQAIAMTSGWDKFATNFANAIIDGVNRAIEAWNWFVDLLPSDIATKIGLEKKSEYSHRESITSDLQGIKAGLKDWVGEAPDDYWVAPKMEMKSLGDAWDKGYNWGANLFKKEEKDDDSDDKIKKAIDDALALGDKLDKGNDAGKKTADNTKKAADGIKMLNEDLKYLRDLAEREAINRYTTAEITVDMKNENYINSEMDIDGIVDKFGEKVEETVAMLAEGGPTDHV